MLKRAGSVLAVVLLSACSGGGSSPSTPTAVATPVPPKDGAVVLNGTVGGKFTLSSSPARLSRSLYGCGDAEVTIPYRETAGGKAIAGDYVLTLWESTGDFARRTSGKATTVTIEAGESGTLRITERFVCIEYTDAQPPRGEVAINFGGGATGAVTQIRGIGPLTVQ